VAASNQFLIANLAVEKVQKFEEMVFTQGWRTKTFGLLSSLLGLAFMAPANTENLAEKKSWTNSLRI